MRHEHLGLSIPDFPLAYGRLLPDTSAAAVEQINSQRLAAGEMKTTAAQIWIQMAHRMLAVLIAATVLAFLWKETRSARHAVLVIDLDRDDSCTDRAWRVDDLVEQGRRCHGTHDAGGSLLADGCLDLLSALLWSTNPGFILPDERNRR